MSKPYFLVPFLIALMSCAGDEKTESHRTGGNEVEPQASASSDAVETQPLSQEEIIQRGLVAGISSQYLDKFSLDS